METDMKAKDMRISFTIDVKAKQVRFYIKQGELRNWVETAIKNLPGLSNEELTKNGSESLTMVMTKTMKRICEIQNIPNWETFKPEFTLYKIKSELPLELR